MGIIRRFYDKHKSKNNDTHGLCIDKSVNFDCLIVDGRMKNVKERAIKCVDYYF